MTRQIDYEGASPSGTTTYTLFDSTAVPALAGAVGKHYRYYSRAMKVTAAGLIKGYASANGGVSWYQFHQRSVLPNATLAFMDEDSVPICPHADVKFTWTNGGSAQSVFYVGQSLCEVEEPLTNHGYDDPLNLVGGSMAHPVQVSGAEVQVGPKGQLLAQLQWDATGSPIGSFVLEYTRDGTTCKPWARSSRSSRPRVHA